MVGFLFRATAWPAYFIAVIWLAATVYIKSQQVQGPFSQTEWGIVFALLLFQLFTIDWGIRSNGWVKNRSDHLYFFPLLFLSLPWTINDLSLMFFASFLWLAFLQLTRFSQKKGEQKHIFNASFLWLTAVLFFPQGIYFFPMIWILMGVFKQFKTDHFILSLLPFLAFALLEGIAVFFEMHLLPASFSSFTGFSFPLSWGVFEGISLGALLLICFLSGINHLADLNARSAAYGTGINALLLLLVFSVLFGSFVASANTHPWGILAIVACSLFPRWIEKIKRPLTREITIAFIFLVFLANTFVDIATM